MAVFKIKIYKCSKDYIYILFLITLPVLLTLLHAVLPASVPQHSIWEWLDQSSKLKLTNSPNFC